MKRLLWIPLLMLAVAALAVPVGWEYDALDFGAIPNDGVDDAAQLQAGIDLMEANGGGQLRIPAGTYMFSVALEIDSDNVSLVGEGMNATILRATNDSIHGIHVDNADNVVIRDLQVRNIEMTGNGERKAIYIEGSDNVEVSHCKIDSVDDAGISVSYDVSDSWSAVSTNCRILYNTVTRTVEGAGIELIGADSTLVHGNKVSWASNTGIRICGAGHTIATNNFVEVNTGGAYCFQVQGGGDGGQPLSAFSDDVLIADNWGSGREGVRVFNRPNNLKIANNIFEGDTTVSVTYGVHLFENGTDREYPDYENVHIAGNTFKHFRHGVFIEDDGRDVFVEGNRFIDIDDAGYAVYMGEAAADTTEYIHVTNNHVKRTNPGGNAVFVGSNVTKAYILGNQWVLGAGPVYIVKRGEEIDWYLDHDDGDTVRTNVEVAR